MAEQHQARYAGIHLLLLLLLLSLIFPESVLGGVQTETSVGGSPLQSSRPSFVQSLTVRVGVYENPPKIYTTPDGTISGFWPDLLRYIADQEGWHLEWVPGTWEQGLARLEQNQIDMMPDVAWTEARSQKYAFSMQKVLVSWSQTICSTWRRDRDHSGPGGQNGGRFGRQR